MNCPAVAELSACVIVLKGAAEVPVFMSSPPTASTYQLKPPGGSVVVGTVEVLVEQTVVVVVVVDGPVVDVVVVDGPVVVVVGVVDVDVVVVAMMVVVGMKVGVLVTRKVPGSAMAPGPGRSAYASRNPLNVLP